MISMLGWIGNVFLVWGIWEIGNRRRFAHLLTIVGESAWITKSMMVGAYDLAVICLIFAGLAARCWFLWAPAFHQEVAALREQPVGEECI